MNDIITILEIALGVACCFGLGMIVEAFIDNRTILDLKKENNALKRRLSEERKNPKQINICEYPAEVEKLQFDSSIRASRKGF